MSAHFFNNTFAKPLGSRALYGFRRPIARLTQSSVISSNLEGRLRESLPSRRPLQLCPLIREPRRLLLAGPRLLHLLLRALRLSRLLVPPLSLSSTLAFVVTLPVSAVRRLLPLP